MSENNRFTLGPLPYAYDALEPYIDERTMFLHHTKHHAGYVDKLNKAVLVENIPGSLVELVALSPTAVIRNNAGGHYNHTLFWSIMAPSSNETSTLSKKFEDKIQESFGSLAGMKVEFLDNATSVFGSGWVWLSLNKENDRLVIHKTGNQDGPLTLMKIEKKEELLPVMCLDVWEHAYYLKYQNKRAEYTEAWWNVVNWRKVSEYYDEYASKGKPIEFEEEKEEKQRTQSKTDL